MAAAAGQGGGVIISLHYYGRRCRDYIAIGDVLCIATASCRPTLRVDVSQMKRRRQGPRRTVNATAVRRARNS